MIRLLVLIALVVAPLCALAQEDGATAARERDRAELLARLESLREETAAAQERSRDLGEELIDIAGDEARLREESEETAQKVAALETRIAEDEVALEELTDRQAAIRHDLAQKRTEIASILMALQRIGRRPPPALLGDTGSAVDTVRGAILLNAVIPTLDEDARRLARTLAEAAQLAADERERWVRLKADLATLERERARLDEVSDALKRRRALSLYERDQAAAALARLSEEEGSVEALIERLEEEGSVPDAPQRAFQARRGSLAAPVAGAVVAEFGEPVEGGGVAEGRTIAALPESTVFAPMAATVLFSAPFQSYGHVLILDAGDGYHMVLAGLERASVTPGDEVETGAPLGRMGRSGSRSAVASAGVKGSALLGARPALYVELRRDGAAIDSHGWWRDSAAEGGRTG